MTTLPLAEAPPAPVWRGLRFELDKLLAQWPIRLLLAACWLGPAVFVAVMGEGAMTTVGRLYWERIHGEPRVALPALPDLVTLLLARDRLPEVRLVDREPPTYRDLDTLHERARRQLWLRPGSPRDGLLRARLAEDVVEHDGVLSLPEDEARIGIVTWVPRSPSGTGPPPGRMRSSRTG